jgi:hypothetical protein
MADLVIESSIMHIDRLEKGIPAERRGRKTTDLRDLFLGQRGYRSDHSGLRVDDVYGRD